MPSDVPGYADLMTKSLDEFESLDEARVWIETQTTPGMGGSGGSGEPSGVTGTGGNGSFAAGVLDWSKISSFAVEPMKNVDQREITG